MNKGTWYAFGAYTLWGLLPVYWKWLATVPALEILAHRVVWSLLFLLVVLSYKRYWSWLKMLKEWRTALTFFATTILLFINWYFFIWAINAGYIVEASLGYFINPLVNVFLGMLFLGERLRQWQWLAIVFALGGVGYLTFSYGSLPWIGLTLAFSFGFYGLLRKTAKLDALAGLSTETAVLLIPHSFICFGSKDKEPLPSSTPTSPPTCCSSLLASSPPYPSSFSHSVPVALP